MKLIEEMHRRVQAKSGNFMSTFTPKAVNADIRRHVDASRPPDAKKYQFSMLDNPVYTVDDKRRILQSLEGFSEAYRRCILYGDWLAGDNAVYYFDPETMVRELPSYYSPGWRHVECSDPATQSALGLVVAAEDPSTNVWYLIRTDYIKDIFIPDKIVDEVYSRTRGLNVVRRIADGHEAWYIHTAAAKGIRYMSPYKKNERKAELIKALQTALGTHRLFVTPWCVDFIDEITSCHYSETSPDKIAKASRFHLLDSAQYLIDCLPKPETSATDKTWEEELRQANSLRKQAAAKSEALKKSMSSGPRSVKGVWRQRRR